MWSQVDTINVIDKVKFNLALITNKDNTSAHFYEITTDNLNIKNITENEVI